MYAINRSPSILPSDIQSLTSAAVIHSFLVLEQCQVSQLLFSLSTSIVSGGDVIVDFKRRPTFGSSVGEVLIGQIKMPNGALAGKSYYKLVSPVVCAAGEEIVIEVSTAASGMGAAGDGQGFFSAQQDPETNANNSDMILSS